MIDDGFLVLLGVLTFAYSALTALVAINVWRYHQLMHIRWFALALTLAMAMRLRDLMWRGLDWPSLIVMLIVLACVARGLSLLPPRDQHPPPDPHRCP